MNIDQNTAYYLSESGIENLKAISNTIQKPKDNEVCFKITYSSLNFKDLSVVLGLYPGIQYPIIPCSDAVGYVVSVGKKVKQFKIGDRVSSVFFPKWEKGTPDMNQLFLNASGGPLPGYLQEYATVGEEYLIHIPNKVSDEVACLLPCAGVTAWHSLIDFGKISSKSSILLQGTGGVSMIALKIAKALGATVYMITSSQEKLEKCKQWGADEVINYNETPNWQEAILSSRKGKGLDLVVDVVGGTTLAAALEVLAVNGKLAVIGVLGGIKPTINVYEILSKMIKIKGIAVGSKQHHKRLLNFIAAHRLAIPSSHTFSLKDSQEALKLFAERKHLGKVKIQIASEVRNKAKRQEFAEKFQLNLTKQSTSPKVKGLKKSR